LWQKVCDRKFVTESLWQKVCDRKFVAESFWQKVCDRNFVTGSLWQKVCNRKFVTKSLWQKVCDRSLWQNVMTETLWQRDGVIMDYFAPHFIVKVFCPLVTFTPLVSYFQIIHRSKTALTDGRKSLSKILMDSPFPGTDKTNKIKRKKLYSSNLLLQDPVL